jgi:hypothetical protein
MLRRQSQTIAYRVPPDGRARTWARTSSDVADARWDLLRQSQTIAHRAPLDGRARTCPRPSPDVAAAASSRGDGGPAGKPALVRP